MTKPSSDKQLGDIATQAGQGNAPSRDTARDDPRATAHPTGEKQAEENANNEPAG
jgi:hypothetical protein